MVGSDLCVLNYNPYLKKEECDHDPMGYFIIKGVEKVFLMQE
jgi:hypothetical protein